MYGFVYESVAASSLVACAARNIKMHVAITPVRVTGHVCCALRPSLQHHVPIVLESAHAALQPRQKRPIYTGA
jgi:hypothetical protein